MAIKITDTHVYFISCWLSNFGDCIINYDGVIFHSSEQLYQYKKAEYHNDRVLMQHILESTNPLDAKRLGGSIKKPRTTWRTTGISEEVMKEVNMLKYLQNKDLRDKLIDTGDRILAECNSGDKFWGTGYSVDSWQVLDSRNWGLNRVGEIIMEVREELKGM